MGSGPEPPSAPSAAIAPHEDTRSLQPKRTSDSAATAPPVRDVGANVVNGVGGRRTPESTSSFSSLRSDFDVGHRLPAPFRVFAKASRNDAFELARHVLAHLADLSSVPHGGLP